MHLDLLDSNTLCWFHCICTLPGIFFGTIISFLLFSWTLSGRLLEPAQICDLLKGVILIVCCLLLNYVDVSMMYHLVRGQAIIKLYIFFNMLEVNSSFLIIHHLLIYFMHLCKFSLIGCWPALLILWSRYLGLSFLDSHWAKGSQTWTHWCPPSLDLGSSICLYPYMASLSFPVPLEATPITTCLQKILWDKPSFFSVLHEFYP